MFLAQDRDRAVFDEFIRPSDTHNRRADHLGIQMLHDGTTKTVVQHVVFDGADDLSTAREKFQRAGIHRFDPARIDQRH